MDNADVRACGDRLGGGIEMIGYRVRGALIAGLILVASSTSACSVLSAPSPDTTMCDGVPADMGGCGSQRPTYRGMTCEELGSEWGQHVDAHLHAVIDGPAKVDDKQRSVLIHEELVLATTTVGLRLQEVGLLGTCKVATFLPAAEREFSDALRATIGSALYDGNPVATYEQFHAEVEHVLSVLDEP
jgi:hypothetical protein